MDSCSFTMKKTIVIPVVASLAATLSMTIGQSKFSGIYPGSIDGGEKCLLTITKGGHVFGINDSSKGLKHAIDPNKSTINSDGKLKAAIPDGTSISGTVTSDFKFKGTGKSSDGGTFRITASRTLN